MTVTLQTDGTFRMTVTAASPAASLAMDFIAGKLGIEPARVAEQMATLPAVLAEALPDRDARRMAAMLSLMGVSVRLDPVLSFTPAEDRAAVALHLVEGADRAAAEARLQRVLGDAADPARLDLAGGLLLPGLADMATEDRRRTLRALQRTPGIRVSLSDPATAVCDLFAPRTPALWAEVSRLGLARCRFSGAAAAGVNLATGRVLLGRAGPGALLIDRAFQRYDLMFQAAPGMAPADVADFLATRPGVDRRSLCDGAPLRLDADLSRAAAQRFVADYAAIGIEVRPALRGRLPESR